MVWACVAAYEETFGSSAVMWDLSQFDAWELVRIDVSLSKIQRYRVRHEHVHVDSFWKQLKEVGSSAGWICTNLPPVLRSTGGVVGSRLFSESDKCQFYNVELVPPTWHKKIDASHIRLHRGEESAATWPPWFGIWMAKPSIAGLTMALLWLTLRLNWMFSSFKDAVGSIGQAAVSWQL